MRELDRSELRTNPASEPHSVMRAASEPHSVMRAASAMRRVAANRRLSHPPDAVPHGQVRRLDKRFGLEYVPLGGVVFQVVMNAEGSSEACAGLAPPFPEGSWISAPGRPARFPTPKKAAGGLPGRQPPQAPRLCCCAACRHGFPQTASLRRRAQLPVRAIAVCGGSCDINRSPGVPVEQLAKCYG